MSHLKHLNKTPEEWNRVNPTAVAMGSRAQVVNVLKDALFDIQKLALEIRRLQNEKKS